MLTEPSPGEVVNIEIDLFPIGLVFYPGQQLRLIVDSHNPMGSLMPGVQGLVPKNKGQHVIHTGGARPFYLRLPVRAA